MKRFPPKGIQMACLASAVLLTAACSSGVRPADLARVANGMKVDQVESLLGRPTRIDESEIPDMSGIISGKVYHYASRQGDAQVVFINASVFKTAFVSGANHA